MPKAPPATQAGVALDAWRAEREGPPGIARRQHRRLATLVAHARTRSPFYARLYRDLPDDAPLTALPPVSKPELMASFDDWVTNPTIRRAGVDAVLADPSLVGRPYRGGYFVCTTSGTTGRPGVFVYDPGALTVYRALSIARIDRHWAPPAQWPALLRRGMRWAAVVGTGGHFAGAGWMEAERRRSTWRRRAYRVFSVQQPIKKITAELDSFDPAILTTYPSALDLLATEQRQGRLSIAPVVIESSGESLLPDVRRRAAAAFGCPVREAYAASECILMAFGCDEGWAHVNADWVVLEPVDADRGATPPGEASHTVLLTNLANLVQPIIRYDLGDSIVVRPDPCPCGVNLPAIRVSGRQDDVMHLPGEGGRLVDVVPLAIGMVVDQTPGVVRCQLVQTARATVRLRLDADPAHDVDAVWPALLGRLREYLAGQGIADVELVRTDEPPEQSATSGKFRRVVVAT